MSFRRLLPVVFGALVFNLSVRCGAEGYVSGLRAATAPHHTDNLKNKAPNTTGSNRLNDTLELLMMGIMVPETCLASNKYHLLHLFGILFPHNPFYCFTIQHPSIKHKDNTLRHISNKRFYEYILV